LIVIAPLNDTTPEIDETITVTLLANAAYVLSSSTKATAAIVDDELPVISIKATDAIASEPGTDTGRFTLTRAGDKKLALTINLVITGTAQNGIDYEAIGSSVIIPANATSVTVNVKPIDDGAIEGNETVVLSLAEGGGYVVDGVSSGTVTIKDDDNIISLLASDAVAAEGGTDSGLFTLSRTGSTVNAVSINLTIGGTAKNGIDYESLVNAVTIPAGASSITIPIITLEDSIAETDETLVLTIATGLGYAIATPNTGTVKIQDNEPATLTVVATDSAASEPGTNTGTFTVTRLGSKSASITAKYTVAGNAISGGDYAELSGSVVIAANAVSATVIVTPLNDTVAELDETVLLTLSPDVEYVVGSSATATVRIADDELPQITIAATDSKAAEPGTDKGTFTITRLGTKAVALAVNYTVAGSATSNSDFLPLTGTITLAANAISATIIVSPLDDSVAEMDETVR
jgi:hypothetical protein